MLENSWWVIGTHLDGLWWRERWVCGVRRYMCKEWGCHGVRWDESIGWNLGLVDSNGIWLCIEMWE